jgi:hypothetical protein
MQARSRLTSGASAEPPLALHIPEANAHLLLAEEALKRHVPHTLLLFELVCSCATATLTAQTPGQIG